MWGGQREELSLGGSVTCGESFTGDNGDLAMIGTKQQPTEKEGRNFAKNTIRTSSNTTSGRSTHRRHPKGGTIVVEGEAFRVSDGRDGDYDGTLKLKRITEEHRGRENNATNL